MNRPNDLPSKWATIVVKRGEGNKHFYWCGDDTCPDFFTSEGDAKASADRHCRLNQTDEILILKVQKLVRAAPIVLDEIPAETQDQR